MYNSHSNRYSSPPLIPHGDEAVQNTTDDAASSKLSSCNYGYFRDDFLHFFVKQPTRRAPLINRGYFARVAAIRKSVNEFLNCFPQDSSSLSLQIVNIGAGLDTMFFWISSQRSDIRFYEIDFAEVIARKAAIILRNESLWSQISNKKDDLAVVSNQIRGQNFRMVAADLRRIDEMDVELRNSGFDSTLPTLFVCECVLVYMAPTYSDKVIKWASSAVKAPSAFIVYEQTNPTDPFGRTMVENLEARGCPLLGLHKYPTITSQIERYKQLGWKNCIATDMNDMYDKFIDQTERQRIEKLEIFDELEEWRLIQAHYILIVACGNAAEGANYPYSLESFSKMFTLKK
ncbi:leucine carboxyl methyltransferase [Cardiosporidium cionae]|uniref:Leucine carboxyl methyltransferase 1 n=1 Tax=Cardiosporidium cionae TaxID=476202 RepID=A0ABQ7JAE1_9APIC|nr:leucine carboxyl methyltransferase [Cardiosporidium cionae]|eukprot:KAF8820908.1 leucine carboxyl methyltransferase [Cardiosporidium cionae]